jgi:hypothetical protein
MRYFLELKFGERVTFIVDGDSVRITSPSGDGAGLTMSRAGAREEWAQLVRDGARRVECEDEDGHDGEACSCSSLKVPAIQYDGHDWDPIKDGPLPGTLAFTARLLAQSGLMTGEEADDWKDMMKDERMGLR